MADSSTPTIQRREPPRSVVLKPFHYNNLPEDVAVARGVNTCLSTHLIELLSNTDALVSLINPNHSEKEIERLMKRKSVVFHSDIPPSDASPEVLKSFVKYTELLLQVASACCVKSFVFASHSNADSKGFGIPYIDDLTEVLIELEKKVLAFNGSNGMATCIIRHHNLYSPYDREFLPSLVKLARERRMLFVGSGNELIDFSYAGNVAHGHLMAAQALAEENCILAGQSLHISDQVPVPCRKFVTDFLSGLGYGRWSSSVPFIVALFLAYVFKIIAFLVSPIFSFKPRLTPQKVRYMSHSQCFDSTKSRQLLHYEPLWSRSEAMLITLHGLDSDLFNPKAKIVYVGPFSLSQVAKHCTADDAWLIVDKKVYDVTQYLWQHPGGNAMLRNVGGDSSVGFHGPQHPSQAAEILEEFYIGNLLQEENEE